jgi:predicted glycogen debranching enzyme
MLPPELLAAEWLEADGLGGFASGTVGGARTRRYHATLLSATTPPTGRAVLVAGFDAWVERQATGRQFLSSQRYTPDYDAAEGAKRLIEFTVDPWPRWTWRLDDGTEIEHELFVPHERPAVCLRWRVRSGDGRGLSLSVRPFLAGRDAHALYRQSGEATMPVGRSNGETVFWTPTPACPTVRSVANAAWAEDPVWYMGFQLDAERERGYDYVEDLRSPGTLTWDLSAGDAVWLLAAEGLVGANAVTGPARGTFRSLRLAELERRSAFKSPLERAGDAYLVRRGEGRTIVAGYPWFTDWGRDTFISLRGLCLATGRLDDVRRILLQWAETVSEGMLPNRFIDQGGEAEYNSVDAALWYIIAVHELRQAGEQAGRPLPGREIERLQGAVEAILEGYARGTRHGIRLDGDGLLASGQPGVQLTWMDAKVGDWVVTPRTGKPVEIQALWLNALRANAGSERWRRLLSQGVREFEQRFWLDDGGYLADVVDVDHQPGTIDASIRPNQLLAVGGLPWPVLEGDRARQVVDLVERLLWTPLGPRSLAHGSPGYAARYQGDMLSRDGAYHQGTVWPWLAGPFVEAWIRVRGNTASNRAEARRRFVEPLLSHLDHAGLGHVSEIADAEPPHTPRGCPFQAWSVAELIRLEHSVLVRAVRRSRDSTGAAA